MNLQTTIQTLQGFDSSVIERLRYVPFGGVLEVKFSTTGAVWTYAGVDPETWQHFQQIINDGESVGSYYNEAIKGTYPSLEAGLEFVAPYFPKLLSPAAQAAANKPAPGDIPNEKAIIDADNSRYKALTSVALAARRAKGVLAESLWQAFETLASGMQQAEGSIDPLVKEAEEAEAAENPVGAALKKIKDQQVAWTGQPLAPAAGAVPLPKGSIFQSINKNV